MIDLSEVIELPVNSRKLGQASGQMKASGRTRPSVSYCAHRYDYLSLKAVG